MSHGAGVLHNALSGAGFGGGRWPWDPGVLRGPASRGRGLAGCMGPAQRLCGLRAQPPGAPAGTLPLPSVQQPSVLGQAPLLPPPSPTSTGPCSCFLTTGSVLAVPASASLSPCILLSFGAILPEADPLSDLPHPTSSGDWVVLFGAVTTPALCPVPEVAGHSSCQGQKPRWGAVPGWDGCHHANRHCSGPGKDRGISCWPAQPVAATHTREAWAARVPDWALGIFQDGAQSRSGSGDGARGEEASSCPSGVGEAPVPPGPGTPWADQLLPGSLLERGFEVHSGKPRPADGQGGHRHQGLAGFPWAPGPGREPGLWTLPAQGAWGWLALGSMDQACSLGQPLAQLPPPQVLGHWRQQGGDPGMKGDWDVGMQ